MRQGRLSRHLRAIAARSQLVAPTRQIVEKVAICWLLRKDLVRIQDAVRVKCIFHAPPPRNLFGAVLDRREVALESA